MMIKIVIFSVCCAEKLKKRRNLIPNHAKKTGFLSLHQNAGRLFYSEKELFSDFESMLLQKLECKHEN